MNRANSLVALGIWGESRTLLRNQLLPAARRSLGPDHDYTLKLVLNIAINLKNNPERTRDNLRLNHNTARRRVATRFYPYAGGDLLEAETIIEAALQRRRRVFGREHPGTSECEKFLDMLRTRLARE